MKLSFYVLLIIFLLSQPIVSDYSSENDLCHEGSLNNYDCASVNLNTEEYECCLYEEKTNDMFMCNILEKNPLRDKDLAFQKETNYYYVRNDIKITCNNAVYEINYTDEDKAILESEEHCFYYNNIEQDKCKNRKLTESAKNAGFECAYYTLIYNGRTYNVCYLVNTDIIKTKKLDEKIKYGLETEIKEISLANGNIIKFNGDKVEIIENENPTSHNKSNILINRFILLILFLIISL